MRSITIVTGSSLCRNPRAYKEARALAQAGHSVEVLGGWLNASLKEQDQQLLQSAPFRFTLILDVTTQKLAWLHSRLSVRMAREWHRRTGRETAWQLGYTVKALTRAALARRRHTDLFIAHSEPALWAVARTAREAGSWKMEDGENRKSEIGNRNFGVGVDMEDWFSEDLPGESRRHRPVKLLKSLERGALSRASHSTCTSRAMSAALAKEYGCSPPTVIYNAFPWSDRAMLDGQVKDRKDRRLPSLHWYSQTLGAGRGLEELFAALPQVKQPLEIHLRGQSVAAAEDWLWPLVPETWRKNVFLHPLVSNGELLSRIAEHDIGFAGEQKYCHSRDLTVTNKILHYLLGGLAVLASDTAGQREVAAQASEAVRLYPSGNAVALAQRLNFWLQNLQALSAAKGAALRAAETIFCWERQEPVLLRNIEALAKP